MHLAQLTATKHIHPIAAFLADQGEPPGPLLRQAGLPGRSLDDPKTLAPTGALWRFRELAARRFGEPSLTWKVMAPLELTELGSVACALLGAPTLLRTIQAFQRFSRAESTTAILDLWPLSNGDVFFSIRFALRGVEGEWQAEQYLLSWMLKIVRLVDPTWVPREIWCTAAVTPDRVQAIESIPTRPRFHQHCTGFPIPASMLVLQQRRHDSGAQYPDAREETLWSMAPSGSASGAIEQLLRAYATDRWLTIEEASQALGTSSRTLQRQISAEGKTYSRILERCRSEVAMDLLESTDALLSEISQSLGYSHLSNFNRAFRGWTGLSPGEFREHRRRAAAPPGEFFPEA